ncbi:MULTISPECIES: acetate/propionate family kinase [unclassified Sulfitobacter]|uniref:acetate/propionate family kinase n=1 Tax=unclassified Sulfitobacter TaxID=196795 RepID=UPI003747403D
MPLVLVVNAGSSSIKAAVFDGGLSETLRIEAQGIGQTGALRVGKAPARPLALPDHRTAFTAILAGLHDAGIATADLSAAAHRVVHGGPDLAETTEVTPAVRAAIAAAQPLAPLHNPHHLSAIEALVALMPELPQFAAFDTGFHRTNPDVARRYALPEKPQTAALRRYGFHGISYESLVRNFTAQTGADLPPRLLALHLGNGASLCAIREGRSVATTMGFSPLGGLTMGTRAGEIDAGAVLHLVGDLGLEAAQRLLHHESGLLGLSGQTADMRQLAESDSESARFARVHFCYWITRQAGSMIAAMGGIDGIAFTGGIGENDSEVREKVLANLRWAGNIPSWVIPAAEEKHIARQALALLKAPAPS